MAKLFSEDFYSAPTLDKVFAQSNTTIIPVIESEPIEENARASRFLPFESKRRLDRKTQKWVRELVRKAKKRVREAVRKAKVMGFGRRDIDPEDSNTRHDALRQLNALGYEIGDEVFGRNIDPEDGKISEWKGEITEDNLVITEAIYKDGKFCYLGKEHENGLAWLEDENYEKGIYFHINRGRDNASVTLVWVFAFEHDTLSKEDQRELIYSFPIRPNTVLETRKSHHTLFLIAVLDRVKLGRWTVLQEKTAYTLGSDPAMKDKPRLMRLAGFNHVKFVGRSRVFDGDTGYDYVPCKLIECNPDPSYTMDEWEAALDEFAQKNGIKPFTQGRFKAYQYITGRLNQKKKGVDYSHPKFTPDFFRTCEESVVKEHDTRCKIWVSLCNKKQKGEDVDPETAWTEPLEEINKFYSQEYDFETVQGDRDNLEANGVLPGETINEYLARKYADGWKEAGHGGRQQWHTFQCPHHGSSSGNFDNCHCNHSDSNYKKGSLSCKSGCDAKDVLLALRQRAKDAGDPLWNYSDTPYKKSKKSNNSQPSVYEIAAKEEAIRSAITVRPGDGELHLNERFIGQTSESRTKIADYIVPGNVYCCPIPMGSGKTTLMRIAIDKDPNARAFVVVPTLNLLYKTVGGFPELKFKTPDEALKDGTSKTANIICCTESLHKVTPEFGDFDIITIDEATVVIDNMLHGGNAEPNRPSIKSNFQRLVSNVKEDRKKVFFLCADMRDLQTNYVRSFNPEPISYIFSDYKQDKGEITVLVPETKWKKVENKDQAKTADQLVEETLADCEEYGVEPESTEVKEINGEKHRLVKTSGQTLKAALISDITQSLTERETIEIAATSKDDVLALKKFILDKFPGTNILDYTGDNSHDPEKKEASLNINNFLARESIQVLIHNSAMGHGASVILTKEYALCLRELDQMVADGASLDKIALKQVELKKIEMNWENLTPWFDAKYGLSSGLTDEIFCQELARVRQNVRTVIAVTNPNTPLFQFTKQGRSTAITEEGQREVFLAKGDIACETQKGLRESTTNAEMLQAIEYIKQEIAKITEKSSPEYEYLIARFAQLNWKTKDRDKKIYDRLTEDGFTLTEKVVPTDAPESASKKLTEAKDKIKWEKAHAFVATESIDYFEKAQIEHKPEADRTKTEKIQVNKYFAEERFPGLQFNRGTQEADRYNAAIWYSYHMNNVKLLSGIKNDWQHQYLDELLAKDTKKLKQNAAEKRSLDELHLNYKFHQFFGDVVFKHIPKDDFDATCTGESLKPLFAELRKSKLFKQLFPDAKLLTDDKIEKRGIWWVNQHLLSHFALKLEQNKKNNDKRTYQLVQLGVADHLEDGGREFNIRKMLTDGLEKQKIERAEREAQKAARLAEWEAAQEKSNARWTLPEVVEPAQAKPLSLIPGLSLLSELIPVD